MIKVLKDLLSDSISDIEGVGSEQFGKRIGGKEEDALLTGNGVSKPIAILNNTGGENVGVTTAGADARRKHAEVFLQSGAGQEVPLDSTGGTDRRKPHPACKRLQGCKPAHQLSR